MGYGWDNPARLLRTVRHLRAEQFINRIGRRILSRRFSRGPAPAARSQTSSWTSYVLRPVSMLSPTRFIFLGRAAELQDSASWNDPAMPKLWLYNMHYFDDLRARDARLRTLWHRDLIGRWIAENPPLSGNGWEPYPLSLRIVNWIAWALAGNDLGSVGRDSLAVQIRVLSGSLEYHLFGNHLLANAKALVFAGCYFSGAEADGWLRNGLALLEREWREQVLSDGGHFELSPMYHAILLEDVLDLIQLADICPKLLGTRATVWFNLAERMLAWLGQMSHPDGEIAFFNDASFGIAPTYGELEAYARSLRSPSTPEKQGFTLGESGYIRLQSGPWVAIFDAAEVGPSYLPGHAHADTLSLEVSVGSHRLVVNSGTSSYEDDAIRLQERSTESHATIEIDGANSSEVWASFRVGRRARPFGRSVIGEAGAIRSASASHDGYRWLPGSPVHCRRVEVSANALVIRDSITGHGEHAIVGRFPLHPLVGSVIDDNGGWAIELAGQGRLRISVQGASERWLTEGYYAPSFGQRVLRPVLAWRYSGTLPIDVETRFEF